MRQSGLLTDRLGATGSRTKVNKMKLTQTNLVATRDAEAEAEAGGSGSLSMEAEAEAEAQFWNQVEAEAKTFFDA